MRIVTLFLLGLFSLASHATAPVATLTIDGAIGPATTDYLVRGIDQAHGDGAQAVVIQLDTPGGLDAATREINQAILAAPIPVVTYVTPEGARAASAGTYILYASHIAAMAPATNLGAATPVNLMGGASPPDADERTGPAEGESDEDDQEPTSAPSAGSAMERKTINDSVAYIRGLAEKRGRNADWAEAAVREAVSLSANEALAQNVIDLVAASLTDLLQQLNGRVIALSNGQTVTLATTDVETIPIEPDWRNRLLAQITDPTIAYLLFMIGLYGLLLEGYNPGALVPGVIGAISLVLALYAFQVLPINYAGLALIVLGIMLIVAEAFAPSFGALGIGGIAALVIGSVILIDTDVPGLRVSLWLIASLAVAAGVGLLWMIGKIGRLRRTAPITGSAAMLGTEVEVLDADGRVLLAGEVWKSQSEQPLQVGDKVTVTGIDGLIVKVEKRPS